MGRVRTKTVKRATRQLIEKFYKKIKIFNSKFIFD